MLDNSRRYELIVRPKGRTPADEYQHNGATWIEGRDGNHYTIDVRNLTGQRALFIISVDGLDVISGQPAGPQSQGYVVGANESLSIPGWMLNGASAAEFYFSRSTDSYVNSLGGTTTNTGVIGAMVFHEQMHAMQLQPSLTHVNGAVGAGTFTRQVLMQPWNSVAYSKATASSSHGIVMQGHTANASSSAIAQVPQDVGTGFGQMVDWSTNQIPFQRANQHHPAAILALYYNSAKNLEKMGIRLRTKRDVSYQANPFPNYQSGGCKPPNDWQG